jgi:hypothetical protein
MTRLSRSLLLAVLLGAAGCGGSAATPDAADGGLPEDAAPPADEQPRVLGDGGCAFEFTACGGDAGACGDPALDCVPLGVDPTHNALCLRRCEHTEECPFNSYCVPDSSRIDYGGLIPAANHCFVTFCGAAYGNGAPFGWCRVGGDMYARVDLAEQRPGTCIPVDSDAGTGVCMENGRDGDGGVSSRDQPCTVAVAAGCQSRGAVVGCPAGTTCVQLPGESEARCRLLCDPLKADPADTSTCTASPQSEPQWCWDTSALARGASGALHVGYWGICQPSYRGCDVFGAPCPEGDGCMPTNMVDTHGVCLAAGQSTDVCLSETDCAPGRLCTSAGPADPLRCRPLCGLGTDGHGCGGGDVCEGVSLDSRSPDLSSLAWGVCTATPDGGVPAGDGGAP